MSVEYKLVITGLEVVPQQGEFTDLVKTVHGRYEAIYENNKSYIAFSVDLYDPGNEFIAFEDLSEEVVSSWVAPMIAVDNIKAMLENQRNPENNAITLTKLPPWSV